MRTRRPLVLLALIAVAACAERGTLGFAPDAGTGTVRDIWTVNYRSDLPPNNRAAPPRPDTERYQRLSVSIQIGRAHV